MTDGDIRRALLRGHGLEGAIQDVLIYKEQHQKMPYISAHVGTSPEDLLEMMCRHAVRQVPIVDEKRCVQGLLTMDELLHEPKAMLQAVIMAGGAGSRLRPLTEDTPKPMLPVAGKPIMEHIVGQLSRYGIRDVSVTTHYKGDKIVDYFGDGEKFGVSLTYVNELSPLGTAGSLSLLKKPQGPLLVINGDVLTELNFKALFTYHREHDALLTMAVKKYDIAVPYGVVESDGPFVTKLREKPQYSFFVNAGVYLLEPEVYDLLGCGKHCDMTDVMNRLVERGDRVVSFPVVEYWLDIGKHEDYQRAQDYRQGSEVQLPQMNPIS